VTGSVLASGGNFAAGRIGRIARLGMISPFATLPDYLEPNLDIVFIGINPGLYSVQKGHYFARGTTRFWRALSASRLSQPIRAALHVETLRPEHDAQLTHFGIGFTDIIKRPTAKVGDLSPGEFKQWAPVLMDKLKNYAPRVACFHGLMGFRPFAKCVFQTATWPVHGLQQETVGVTRLFVVPNPSGANAHFTLVDQTMWYDRLAEFIARC
jgi:double-stranded uracil-DNA glycosylase